MKGVFRSNTLRDCKNDFLSDILKSKFFDTILSDNEILQLQEFFMTPSVHYVKTKNILQGRKLIDLFLHALNHYHHVACLTVENQDFLPIGTLDLYSMINHEFYNKSFLAAVEDFLIEAPYIDFIWVEFTQSLLGKVKENEFKAAIDLLTFCKEVPVVIVSYTE